VDGCVCTPFASPEPTFPKKRLLQSAVGQANRREKRQATAAAEHVAIQQQIADAAALPEVKAELGRHLQNYEGHLQDLNSALESI
jgi:hypothetical protein